MSWVVSTNCSVLKTYDSLGGARRALTRKWKKRYPNAVIHSRETFDSEIDKMVEVTTVHGKKCMIRASHRGTCLDPSTELYWSM